MGMYGGPRLVADVGGPSLTVQAAKDECDINKIIARYVKTGLLSHMSKGVPRFVDVSEVGDYRSAIEHLRSSEEWFGRLPAEVRREFENDVAVFLDAMDTEEGRARLASLEKGEVDVVDVQEPPPKVEAAPAQ